MNHSNWAREKGQGILMGHTADRQWGNTKVSMGKPAQHWAGWKATNIKAKPFLEILGFLENLSRAIQKSSECVTKIMVKHITIKTRFFSHWKRHPRNKVRRKRRPRIFRKDDRLTRGDPTCTPALFCTYKHTGKGEIYQHTRLSIAAYIKTF